MDFVKELENLNPLRSVKLGFSKDQVLKYKDEIPILKNTEIVGFDRCGANSCRVFYKLKKMPLKTYK